MPDYIWKFEDIKITVWETNKSFSLGYFRWDVKRWLPDLEWWDILDSSQGRWMTFDDAVIQAFDAFYQYGNVTIDCDCQQYYPVNAFNMTNELDGSFGLHVRCLNCNRTDIHDYDYQQVIG